MTESWFLAPVVALVFGVLALAPLGHQVLARGVVFIDLAVAQAAAAAALWAGTLMDHPDWISTQTSAAAGALACAAAVACRTRSADRPAVRAGRQRRAVGRPARPTRP